MTINERTWISFADLPVGVDEWFEISDNLKSKGIDIEGTCVFGSSLGYRYSFTVPLRELNLIKGILSALEIEALEIEGDQNNKFLLMDYVDHDTKTKLDQSKEYTEEVIKYIVESRDLEERNMEQAYQERDLKERNMEQAYQERDLEERNMEQAYQERMALEEQIETVKGLLKKSFGKNAKGNRIEMVIVLDIDNMYKDANGLAGITNQTWFTAEYHIGNFLAQDGSRLEVFRKYKKEANKYAELFEETFGRKALVNLI